MGVWSDATNGWDSDLEYLMPTDTEGFAGIWHPNQPPAWTGPSGYYLTDLRAYPSPLDSVTWSPIHVWASDSFPGSTMSFTIQGNPLLLPPEDRLYSLTLISVPKAVTGAPSVGTTWSVPAEGPLTLELPTYRDVSGEDAYKFAFTVSAVVPEPTGALMLGLGAVLYRRRGMRTRP
jgi:hypothetical protein